MLGDRSRNPKRQGDSYQSTRYGDPARRSPSPDSTFEDRRDHYLPHHKYPPVPESAYLRTSTSIERQESQAPEARQQEHPHELGGTAFTSTSSISEKVHKEIEKLLNTPKTTQDIATLHDYVYHKVLTDEERMIYNEELKKDGYHIMVDVDTEIHQKNEQHKNIVAASDNVIRNLQYEEHGEYFAQQMHLESRFWKWREDNQLAPLDKGNAPDTTEHLEDRAFVSFIIERMDHKYITGLNNRFNIIYSQYTGNRLEREDSESLEDLIKFKSKRNKTYKTESHKQKAIISMQRGIKIARELKKISDDRHINNFLAELERLRQVYNQRPSDQAVPSSS